MSVYWRVCRLACESLALNWEKDVGTCFRGLEFGTGGSIVCDCIEMTDGLDELLQERNSARVAFAYANVLTHRSSLIELERWRWLYP